MGENLERWMYAQERWGMRLVQAGQKMCEDERVSGGKEVKKHVKACWNR